MTDKEKIIIDLKQALDGLDITSNLRLVLINTIEYLQKELVSEDFEEAMQHNVPDNIGIDDLLYWRNGFISGAKWKKEQMIAKAIDGKVIANGMGKPILHLWDKGKHLIDEKVKVIIIKED